MRETRRYRHALPWIAAASALFTGCPPPKSGATWPEPLRLADSLPEAWREEPVVVLSDSIRIHFVAPADGSENRTEVVQISWFFVQRADPPALENLVVHEYESFERIPKVRATVWMRESGTWKTQGNPPAFVRRKFNDAGIYSSNHYLHWVRVSKYGAGLAVRLETMRDVRRPEFLKSDMLRRELPVLRKHLGFQAPPAADLKIALLNGEGLQARSGTRRDSAGTYFWAEAAGLSKALPSAPVPKAELWFAAAHYSLPPRGLRSLTWSELGDHYLALAEPFLRRDTALAALAKGLAPAGSPPRQVVEKAFAHIQANFRYHADLERLHAFVPRPIAHILKQGWGDCKELSSLFAALLRERGLETRLALVSVFPAPQSHPDFPSLGGFNHMVAAWKDGQTWRFVDATANFGDAASSHFPLIGQRALLLDSGGSRLVEIEAGPDWKNRVATLSRIAQDGSGWRLRSEIVLEGESARDLYPVLKRFQGEERGPFLRTWLQEMFGYDNPKASLKRFDWKRMEIEVEAPYDRGYLAVDKGGLALEEPTLIGGAGRFTAIRIEGPRQFRAFEQTDRWEIPPEFSELRLGGWQEAHGIGSWKRQGPAVEREYRQKGSVFEAADSSELARFQAERKRFMRNSVWKK